MRKETMPKNTSFQATEEFKHEIRMAAAKRNQTPSAFMRDAIRHYMRWLEQQEREQQAAE